MRELSRKPLLLLAIGAAFAAAIGASSGAVAVPPCVGGTSTDLRDYADDVDNTTGSTRFEEAGHADFDILEVVTCVSGPELTLGLRVAGAIHAQDPKALYQLTLWWGNGTYWDRINFKNGTASSEELGNHSFVLNSTASGAWLVASLPFSANGNATDGWYVEGGSYYDANGDQHVDFSDEATLSPFGEFGGEADIALEPTPFGTPTVAISLLTVTQNSGGLQLVVEGTTAGPVAELRVTVGAYLRVAGGRGDTWSYEPYTIDDSSGTHASNFTLEKVGGSWARWRFTFLYDSQSIMGLWEGAPYTSVTNAKVEVRAIAQDGHWGHASREFAPFTTTPLPGGGSSVAGNGTVVIVVGALFVVLAVFGTVVFLAWRFVKGRPPTPPIEAMPRQPPRW